MSALLEHTEHLVGLPEAETQAILLHELPVLLRAFASHLDAGYSRGWEGGAVGRRWVKVEGKVFSVAAKCKNFELSAIRLIGSSYYGPALSAGYKAYVTAGLGHYCTVKGVDECKLREWEVL